MNPLLNTEVINEPPLEYLRRVGQIFAEFGASTQDSGNRSYGVQVGDERYFVKTAGCPGDMAPVLSYDHRVALLRNAVQLSRSCDHPALPALHAVIESPEGPLIIYEWMDGELLGVPRAVRDDPASSVQRFRRLHPSLILKALDTIYDLHRELAQLGWIAVDFYDGSIVYNFATDHLAVVDLDNYHLGPFQNRMGRMIGSSQFMAPEEFELGAVIDERTNVYVMGRTAAIFLSEGTLEREPFRGSMALHQVVTRACDTERSQRFASMLEFHKAWRLACIA